MKPNLFEAQTPAPAAAAGVSDETAAISAGDRSAGQFARQLQRIGDQRNEALGQPDPYLAVIGAANADGCEFQALLAEQLREAFYHGDVAIDNLPQYAPAVNMYLRLGKQTSQFFHLLLGLKKLNKQT